MSQAVALGLVVVTGSLADAQEPPESEPEQAPVKNIEELNLEQLLGTVTAASRTEESVATAPASVTVLDYKDIRQSGATTIPDLLRKVPGVQVLEVAPGSYLVSLRGIGGLTGNNVVVLVDGNPVNSRVDGNVDWSLIPVDLTQIERIEVVRGPVSTIYGPNAYTGVINIILSAPSDARIAGQAHVAAGIDTSGHPAGVAAGAVGGTTGKLSGRFTANGRYDSTFSGASNTPAWATGGGTGFVKYDPSDAATLSLEVGGAFSRRSALDHLVLESLPQNNTLVFGTLRLLIHKMPSVFDSLEIWLRAKNLSISASQQSFTGFNYGGVESFDQQLGFDLRFALPRHFKLALGANGGVDYVDAPFLNPLENRQLRPRYGFYADGGWEWRKLTISAAVRGDASALANGLHFAGRGSVIYHEQKWALRLTAGSAYRDPTYVEVGGRFVDPKTSLILLEGTPGLAPPQITSIEFGAILAPWSRLTIKPTVFVNEMSNLMVENFEPLVRKTFVNDPTARWVLGGELEASLALRKEIFLEANVVGLYWISNPASAVSPTVGTPQQNSLITAWLGARSDLLDGRLGLALGAGYESSRLYDLRAGIPPMLLAVTIPDSVRFEGSADYNLTRRAPLWVTLKVLSHVPHGNVEAPFPNSSLLGTSIFVALEYR